MLQYYLVDDFSKKPSQPLFCVVVPRDTPDHANAIENIRKDRRDIYRFRFSHFSAGLLEGAEKFEIVIGFFAPRLNHVLQCLERVTIRRSRHAKNSNDVDNTISLQLLPDPKAIDSSRAPKFNLLERPRIVNILGSFLIGDDFLDLPSPMDQCRLKSLYQVLIGDRLFGIT
jgi:hypothetical protein